MLLMMLVVTVSLFANPTDSRYNDPWDPPNQIDKGEVLCGATVTDTLVSSTSHDVYEFTIPDGICSVRLSFCDLDLYDSAVAIFDDSFQIILQNDDGCGFIGPPLIDDDLTDFDTSIFYIRVSGFSTAFGTYQMDVTCDTCDPTMATFAPTTPSMAPTMPSTAPTRTPSTVPTTGSTAPTRTPTTTPTRTPCNHSTNHGHHGTKHSSDRFLFRIR
eukprot:720209_1